jgi:hypothetical protein
MIILLSIKQTGQYLGTPDLGFLGPLRSASKQDGDLPAALCEIDAPPRAQMETIFRWPFVGWLELAVALMDKPIWMFLKPH